MTIRVAYSGFSYPSAQKIAEQGDVALVRSSTQQVDVNWGRSVANARLNPDTTGVSNKQKMRRAFQAANVPMPRLIDGDDDDTDWSATLDFVARGGIVLGRPDRHTQHRGMWLVRNERDLERALLGTRKKHAATHFMEWVTAEREYRVHIFKGHVIRISRKDYHDDAKTWVAVRPGDIPLSTVRDAARRAVAAVSLDFGAVDVLARGERNDEVFVLEVNTAPGLGGSMPRVYFDTFTRWKESGE